MNQIEHIKTFIKNHNILVLATNDKDQPHACTVFYVTGNAKTLFFKSYAVATHSNNLKTNSKISAVIYDKESSPFGEKQGVQILGTAERISDLAEATEAVDLYIKTFNSPKDKFYPVENMTSEDAESSMYKVQIEKVKMLDSVNGIKPEMYLDLD